MKYNEQASPHKGEGAVEPEIQVPSYFRVILD